jgi:hypothetical protein
MRVRLPANHHLLELGKKNPQVPPLHLHFDQIETFKILQGAYGVTTGYDLKDTILTPDSPPFHITPMMPHFPWPVPGKTGNGEDTIILLVVHPKATEQPLGVDFFFDLFQHISDAYEQKKMPDLLKLMHAQHETASSNVMFPSLWFLGSLRWWVPWKLQAGVAMLASWMGYKIPKGTERKEL